MVIPAEVPTDRIGVVNAVVSVSIPSDIESTISGFADAIGNIHLYDLRVGRVLEPGRVNETIKARKRGSDLVHGDDVECTQFSVEIISW
ncbi:hypothetical protein [Halorarum halobium]|uniref:hypothetical protein n=1 Tax=Halorarum halobium TaxID=3075121 RepID=UPI0028AAAF9D|nr:hypothetical protein [Halobaculum sp. XH14]